MSWKVSVRPSPSRQHELADDDAVNETIEVGAACGSTKRLRRGAEEKRRIVETTLFAGNEIRSILMRFGGSNIERATRVDMQLGVFQLIDYFR